MIIITLSLFIQSDKLVLIEEANLMKLDRGNIFFTQTSLEQNVILFQGTSCFNCIPELKLDFTNADFKFLFQTPPLSALERKSLIQKFNLFGVNKNDVILFINLEEEKYFKKYELAVLKKVDGPYFTLELNSN